MEWGGGASYDVELSRTGIGVLTVNGSLTVSSTLTVTGGMAGTHGQNVGTGDSPTFAALTLTGNVSAAGGYANSGATLSNANPWYGTPSTTRAAGTVYQNATGKTIIVYISVQIAGNAVGETNYVSFQIGPTSTPATPVAYASNSTVNLTIPFAMIVPNGYYYELINNGAALAGIVWVEQYL
jgi:hypothetical protein